MDERLQVISLAWLESAKAPAVDTGERVVAGIDVAGPGKDETVVTVRCGDAILEQGFWTDADPRGRVVQLLNKWRGRLEAANDIDGVMQSLAINGQPVVVNLDGTDPAARKQQLADAINNQAIGINARILCDRVVLIAADGRNISVRGTGTTADVNSVGKEVLNFGTAVLAESVVARGGVTLEADHGFSSFSAARGVFGWGIAGRARVFFKHNNVNFGNVGGLVNKDTSAGIVKMTANPDQQVFIFGQLGDPGGMTTFQFDIPDNQMSDRSTTQP